MQINLTRLDCTQEGIFGHITVEGSLFNCVTLERHDIAIPVGSYKISLYNSPVHGLVPLLHDVPGRDMIEIHEGNFEHNSKGCILVGEKRALIEGKEAIANSKKTLLALVTLIRIGGRDSSEISISIS